MPQPYQPPQHALISGRPVRHVKDPDGVGVWQKYDYGTGEFVEDRAFVQPIIMFGVDPTSDERGPSTGVERVTKAEFDERVRDLEDKRLAAR